MLKQLLDVNEIKNKKLFTMLKTLKMHKLIFLLWFSLFETDQAFVEDKKTTSVESGPRSNKVVSFDLSHDEDHENASVNTSASKSAANESSLQNEDDASKSSNKENLEKSDSNETKENNNNESVISNTLNASGSSQSSLQPIQSDSNKVNWNIYVKFTRVY